MRQISVWIDDKRVRLPESNNGAGLLAAVQKDTTYRVYQEASTPHAFDLPIEPNERIILRKGFSFYTIPHSGPHGANAENDAGLRERAKPFTPKVRSMRPPSTRSAK